MLSEVLDQYDISRVDLLKVDIEGSPSLPRTVLKRARRSDRILSLIIHNKANRNLWAVKPHARKLNHKLVASMATGHKTK
jgi:hypothetical protein